MHTYVYNKAFLLQVIHLSSNNLSIVLFTIMWQNISVKTHAIDLGIRYLYTRIHLNFHRSLRFASKF